MNTKNKKWMDFYREMVAVLAHTQKEGMASYDSNQYFTFTPDNPVAGSIHPYRSQGQGQLMSDGTFYFVRKPRLRAQSRLIKKLPHGRLSETKDGAIQLTIKIAVDEDDIPKTIGKEASEAKKALTEWLKKPWEPWK